MASLWEDVKKAIVEGYVYAADKADEMTLIGKAKLETLRANRKIAGALSALGDRTFELFGNAEQEAMAEDPEIIEGVRRIRALQEELRNWEKEIERIRAERDSRPVETKKIV